MKAQLSTRDITLHTHIVKYQVLLNMQSVAARLTRIFIEEGQQNEYYVACFDAWKYTLEQNLRPSMWAWKGRNSNLKSTSNSDPQK